MNNTRIVYFSQNAVNKDLLLNEISKICNWKDNIIHFHDEHSLLSMLKTENQESEMKRLIILDIKDSDKKTINFIKSVNQSSQNSIKLIIAENHQFYEIQQNIENNTLMQYLNKPWEPVDLNIALNIASHTFSMHPNNTGNHGNIRTNGQSHMEITNERMQKLIDANLAKDNFLSIIAHDLKSPFTALLGISEILMDNWNNISDNDKLDLIADLRKTSVDTYKLLENLLAWAKSQKEKFEVNINPVEIHKLVNSVLKISKKNASVKNIKIRNTIDEELVIQTDENMIATVFRNLISNAVQNLQPGSYVNISAEKGHDFHTFCVADNGKGIDLPHILEVFSKNNQKKLNGNINAFKGLGLIICKDFVERNGGQIWLETQPDQGCKFYFTVPQ